MTITILNNFTIRDTLRHELSWSHFTFFTKRFDRLKHKRIQFEWFILKTDEILLVHDCIINFHKLNCWHKCIDLQAREQNYDNGCKVFIPNWHNKPYFF